MGVLPGLPLTYLRKPDRQRGTGDTAGTSDKLGKCVGIGLPELLFSGKATDLDFYVSSVDF